MRQDRGAGPAFVRAVGGVSVALAALGVARPRALTSAGGVVQVPGGGVVELVVRLGAARQGVIGMALLTRHPADLARSSGLFLPLTAVDAAVVVAAVRSGVLRPRAAAMSLAVLATNVGIALRVRA